MELVVPAIVFGSVGTAGQRCTSTRRIIAHSSRFEELKAALVKAYRQIRIGDPLNPDTLMGPLIDDASMQRVEAACAAVRDAGGEVLCGGERIEGPGNFITPAIAVAKNDWDVVQTETFGPILYLIQYDTLDEAIAMQNGVVQGLSSSIFTDNLQNAEYFLSAGGSDCGIANVNIGTSGAEIGGAFGGEKETGGGREAGSDCVEGVYASSDQYHQLGQGSAVWPRASISICRFAIDLRRGSCGLRRLRRPARSSRYSRPPAPDIRTAMPTIGIGVTRSDP